MARGENIVRFAQAPPIKAASAVYVTLAAQVVSLGALVLFERVRGRELATQLAAFGGRPQGADAEALVGAVTVFAVLMMLTTAATVAAAAAYVTWLVRARQANDPSAPSAAVAGAWLIPGVNLVGPRSCWCTALEGRPAAVRPAGALARAGGGLVAELADDADPGRDRPRPRRLRRPHGSGTRRAHLPDPVRPALRGHRTRGHPPAVLLLPSPKQPLTPLLTPPPGHHPRKSDSFSCRKAILTYCPRT